MVAELQCSVEMLTDTTPTVLTCVSKPHFSVYAQRLSVQSLALKELLNLNDEMLILLELINTLSQYVWQRKYN